MSDTQSGPQEEGLWTYIGQERAEPDGNVFRSRMVVQPRHMAPNGYMQATVAIGLADMACAGGTFATVPEGCSFTTIELKTNMLGSARAGDTLMCEATLRHSGRTTQVWDAAVTHEDTGRNVALFRCTQLILYPQT